jgi:hypothetical protein
LMYCDVNVITSSNMWEVNMIACEIKVQHSDVIP